MKWTKEDEWEARKLVKEGGDFGADPAHTRHMLGKVLDYLKEVESYMDYLEKKEDQLRARLAEEDVWSSNAAARISRLEMGVRRYGRHETMCQTFFEGGDDTRECFCGLDAILKSD